MSIEKKLAELRNLPEQKKIEIIARYPYLLEISQEFTCDFEDANYIDFIENTENYVKEA